MQPHSLASKVLPLANQSLISGNAPQQYPALYHSASAAPLLQKSHALASDGSVAYECMGQHPHFTMPIDFYFLKNVLAKKGGIMAWPLSGSAGLPDRSSS